MKNKTYILILFILEILIILSYASAFVPFLYILIFFGLVPLTLTNMILSIIFKSNTRDFAIANLIIAIAGIIPFVGYILRIIGFILALLSAVKLGDKLK